MEDANNAPSDSSSAILTEHLEDDLSFGPSEYDPFDCDDYKLLFNSTKGRNILEILSERSCYGGRGDRWRWVRSNGTQGDRSHKANASAMSVPTTPVVNGMPNNMDDAHICHLSPPPHNMSLEHGVGEADEAAPEMMDVQNFNGAPSTPVSNNAIMSNYSDRKKAITEQAASNNPIRISFHSELISHIEYSAVTRFNASYLKHLGGSSNHRITNSLRRTMNDRNLTHEQLETQELLRQHLRQEGRSLPGSQENSFRRRLLNPLQRSEIERSNNNPIHSHRPLPHHVDRMPNRPNPNPSVSTISISFSPDGRTMASSHGDHSVKITCAHTGKLIRTLEGHPRTPWTVKYHPTNNRIVASGCLGFQVRVWDWNYRTDAVRGKWRRENERKYGKRYNAESTNFINGRCYSPRGVVEDSWRGNERKEKHQEAGKDDYAASTLEMLGIPQSDPVWYEIQCESFNYHDGIGVCLNMIRLNHAIISLAFHPSGEVLAVASGSTLHLWDYDEEDRKLKKKQELEHVASRNPAEKTNNNASHSRISESRILNRDSTSEFPSSRTLNISHESALRCVHFPPCGTTLIIGGVNPPSANEGLAHRHPRGRGGMSGGGMSFHLRLWEFDLEATLNAPVGSSADPPNVPNNGTHLLGASVSDEGDITWNFSSMRRALSNPRIIIPRVLLYNDGGFDISQDGKILSACAEYWLPEGIDNAMELLEHQQDVDHHEEEKSNTINTPNGSRATSPTLEATPYNQTTPSPMRTSLNLLLDHRTPPPNSNFTSLEPPPPPGNRNLSMRNLNSSGVIGLNLMSTTHIPHPLSMVAPNHPAYKNKGGRYVPHIVTISMGTSFSLRENDDEISLTKSSMQMESIKTYPKLGQVLNATPLDGTKASGVTCVKLSPSAEYCLLGYGVRDNLPSTNGNDPRHPVTALYNVKEGMLHVSTLTSIEDDVNIARFHPESGHGFVYGTKQGRVRLLSTRPWNHYHL